ncbi:MAG: class I SAM-dependent methyltransferase [Acidobacteria bacterium]|nr:MAG: class I SAM-dependent methyltransferase [Acidobacteriota bacterium]
MNAGAIFRLPAIAAAYDLLTAHQLWCDDVARLLQGAALAGAGGRRVLDLGCGTGTSTFVAARLLAGAEVVGVDLARAMIERARRRHRRRHPDLTGVRFEVADAARLPFPDASFDLVLGHSVLYLLPDRAAALRQARRVLAPGGRLLLMEPDAEGSLWRAAAANAGRLPGLLRRPLTGLRFLASMVLWRLVSGGAGRLSAARLEGSLRAAGFDRVEIRPTLGGLGLHCAGAVEGRAEQRPGRG